MLTFVIILAFIGLGLAWWIRAKSLRRRHKHGTRNSEIDQGNPFE